MCTAAGSSVRAVESVPCWGPTLRSSPPMSPTTTATRCVEEPSSTLATTCQIPPLWPKAQPAAPARSAVLLIVLPRRRRPAKPVSLLCVYVRQACLQQRCQDVSVFAVDDCRSQCNGHGVRATLLSHMTQKMYLFHDIMQDLMSSRSHCVCGVCSRCVTATESATARWAGPLLTAATGAAAAAWTAALPPKLQVSHAT